MLSPLVNVWLLYVHNANLTRLKNYPNIEAFWLQYNIVYGQRCGLDWELNCLAGTCVRISKIRKGPRNTSQKPFFNKKHFYALFWTPTC